MKKTHMYSWDLLRVLSFLSILYYHMIVEFQVEEIFPAEKINLFVMTKNLNIHIASLAVNVFFMLSGACLTYSLKEDTDLKCFYRKHFLKLLVPYWITVFSWNIVRIIASQSLETVFISGVPKWHIVFTFLGLDTWVSAHGIPTYTNGIGEWFLGEILILYLLFPVLHNLMEKNEKLFFIIATGIWICTLILTWQPFSASESMNLFLREYEFILGMYFGKHVWQLHSVKILVLCIIEIVLILFVPCYLPIDAALKTTITAVSAFYMFTFMENLLQRKSHKIILKLSSYSYEVFLVHHVIIQRVTSCIQVGAISIFNILAAFLAELILIVIFAVSLKKICRFLHLQYSRCSRP